MESCSEHLFLYLYPIGCWPCFLLVVRTFQVLYRGLQCIQNLLMWDDRYWTNLIIIHADIQFSQYYLFKIQFFLLCVCCFTNLCHGLDGCSYIYSYWTIYFSFFLFFLPSFRSFFFFLLRNDLITLLPQPSCANQEICGKSENICKP